MNKTAVQQIKEYLEQKLMMNRLMNYTADEVLEDAIGVCRNTINTKEKQQMENTWSVAHQAGRFEGKGIAEENWQTFEEYYTETYGGGNV
jgi:DNA-binding XRE family transcriptional regulator